MPVWPVLDLVLIAPEGAYTAHAPGGALFAEQYFAAARLEDRLSAAQRPAAELVSTLRYLQRRFPGRIRVQWVSLWSLRGLWLCFRYRVRHFPALVLPDGRVLWGKALGRDVLREVVATYLSGQSVDTGNPR